MNDDVLLDTTEAAAALGLKPARVRQLAQSGALPAKRVGRDWVIRRADLDTFKAKPRPTGRPRKDQP